MKLLLLFVALSCWAAPSVLAGNFVCYFPNWAGYRNGKCYLSIFYTISKLTIYYLNKKAKVNLEWSKLIRFYALT